jgi:putative peptidoglycan lipid II flippase
MKTSAIKKISYITILSLGNSALNFLFQVVIARTFGTGTVTDAFFLAFSIPEWVMNITVFIIPVIIIPFISGYIAKGEEDRALSLTTSIMTIFVVGLSVIIAGLYILNGPIARGVAGNLGAEGIEVYGNVSLSFSPVILFTTMSSLLTGVYYSYERYFVPNLSPILQTLIMIGGVLIWKNGLGIQSAAVFMLIGSFFRYLLLVVLFHKRKLFLTLKIIKPEVKEDVKEVVIFMVPLLIGQVVLQSQVLVDRYIASILSAGSITYLFYAFRLTTIFKRLSSLGTNTVIFPKLSKSAAINDTAEFEKRINDGMCFITFVSLMVVGGMLLFSTNVVYVLFKNDQFRLFDAVQTGLALRAMSIYIVAFSLVEIINNVFYSIKNTKIPLILGISTFALSILVKILLSRIWAHVGIAIASSFTAVLYMTVGIVLLKLTKRKIRFGRFFKNALQNGISIAAAFGVVFIIVRLLLPKGYIFFPNKFAEFGAVAGLWILMALLYMGFNFLLKNDIAVNLFGRFKRDAPA